MARCKREATNHPICFDLGRFCPTILCGARTISFDWHEKSRTGPFFVLRGEAKALFVGRYTANSWGYAHCRFLLPNFVDHPKIKLEWPHRQRILVEEQLIRSTLPWMHILIKITMEWDMHGRPIYFSTIPAGAMGIYYPSAKLLALEAQYNSLANLWRRRRRRKINGKHF